MADEYEAQETDDADLSAVHARSLIEFDADSVPQSEIRAHALMCRRFISIPGAMWEGPFGDQFANSIKIEVDKLSKGVDKIVSDYRSNRIVPDFRPSGGNADPKTADTLDGVHRADSYHFKAQQARDNAFEEAASGGFGAYRLVNDLSDPYDKDSDEQRINPGMLIADADQRVYFDANSKLYDKSDAKRGWVLTAVAKQAFEDEYPGKASDWPENRLSVRFEWFTPDVVIKCEKYEVEEKKDELLIFTHRLTGEEQRWWADEIEDDYAADLKKQGWTVEPKDRLRKRVRKYVMSGAEILEDTGYIAGSEIPIVPVYGKRWFVDNQERFRGHVSKRMDSQRNYNAMVSKLAEINALAPREKPIFLAEQLPPNLQALWAEQEQMRHPYALVNPVLNPDGTIAAMGPIGKIEPPQLQPVTAALLQIAANDLSEETDDGADEVVANTSADAMDIAAARIDAKSEIYLDNMRQSVQREGEIYLSMCKEVYFEPGRVVETMSEDGEDGEATLHQAYTDKTGKFGTINDFSQGKYKVIVDVTEATATRRDKTVKQSLNIAEIAAQAQDMELSQISILTAVMNQDGEGMNDLQTYARKRLVMMGVVQPNDEEKQQMAQQQQQQQQDPKEQLLAAKIEEVQASAGQKKADSVLSLAKAQQLGKGGDATPQSPIEDAAKVAEIHKTVAETANLNADTHFMPQKLAIEELDAHTKRLQALQPDIRSK